MDLSIVVEGSGSDRKLVEVEHICNIKLEVNDRVRVV
jgi:hypothetical protein